MMRTHVRVEVGNRGAQNVPPCKVKFTEEVFLFFKMSAYPDDSIIITVLIIESLAQPTYFAGRWADTV